MNNNKNYMITSKIMHTKISQHSSSYRNYYFVLKHLWFTDLNDSNAAVDCDRAVKILINHKPHIVKNVVRVDM